MPTNQTQPLIFNINNYKFSKHIIKTEKNSAIIPLGILPGFNPNIDTANYDFEKDLMHNFTFIDLIPVSYSLKMLEGFYDMIKVSNPYSFAKGFFSDNETAYRKKLKTEMSKKLSGSLYQYSEDQNNAVAQAIAKILNQYFGNYFNDKTLYTLRLIGSQDSVYSETLQNRFGDNNIVDQLSTFSGGLGGALISNIAQSTGKGGNAVIGIAHKAMQALKEIPKYNYDVGINIMKSMASQNSLMNIFTKELLGLQISLPRVFENSNYVDSLNVFLRLTSPTGSDEDIRSYILAPLIILMTMAAPLSFDGVTYGYPPIWQIKSYGNSFQTVGVIDVITITRGSMETTYSDNLEPLSVDVRITLSSLNHHYSSILKDTTKNNLLFENGVGMTSAANIEAGITKKPSDLKIYSINI